MALILVDLLGTRERWKTGGLPAIKTSIEEFRILVKTCIAKSPIDSVVCGGIETDAAAFVFRPDEEAFRFGQRLFKMALSMIGTTPDRRPWLRGAVVADEGITELRNVRTLLDDRPMIRDHVFAEPLKKAVSVERAGNKGMRIIVHMPGLSITQLGKRLRVRFDTGEKTVSPFKKLKSMPYVLPVGTPRSQARQRLARGLDMIIPTRRSGMDAHEFYDFLWMVCPTAQEWESLKNKMVKRQKLSGMDVNELLQSIATQLVFHECGSLLKHIKGSKQGAT